MDAIEPDGKDENDKPIFDRQAAARKENREKINSIIRTDEYLSHSRYSIFHQSQPIPAKLFPDIDRVLGQDHGGRACPRTSKDDPRPQWVQQAERVGFLTPAEERDLVERMRAGDPKARSDLIAAHWPLCAKAAKKYRAGLDLEAAQSAAMLGLIAAVDSGNFDPAIARLSHLRVEMDEGGDFKAARAARTVVAYPPGRAEEAGLRVVVRRAAWNPVRTTISVCTTSSQKTTTRGMRWSKRSLTRPRSRRWPCSANANAASIRRAIWSRIRSRFSRSATSLASPPSACAKSRPSPSARSLRRWISPAPNANGFSANPPVTTVPTTGRRSADNARWRIAALARSWPRLRQSGPAVLHGARSRRRVLFRGMAKRNADRLKVVDVLAYGQPSHPQTPNESGSRQDVAYATSSARLVGQQA